MTDGNVQAHNMQSFTRSWSNINQSLSATELSQTVKLTKGVFFKWSLNLICLCGTFHLQKVLDMFLGNVLHQSVHPLILKMY